MDIMKIYGSDITNLEQSLRYQSKRHLTHASNLANVSTPQYKALEFSFENNLREAYSKPGNAGFLTKTHEGHMSPYSPVKLRKTNDPVTRVDGNNVNLDKEVIEVSKNNIDYNATLSFLNHEFTMLKTSIKSDGGE